MCSENQIDFEIEELIETFDDFCDSITESSSRNRNEPKNIVQELVQYECKLLSFPNFDFKRFWTLPDIALELPKLYDEAIRTNTICSSSAPSESCFSVAGYQERKERSSLKSKTLRYEMLAKQFSKISVIFENF